MVALNELTEGRIRETGERLMKRAKGIEVQLVDAVSPPVRIRSSR